MQVWKVVDRFEINKHKPDDDFFSHAQLPTPLVLAENRVRVFFATRNKQQQSKIDSVDLIYDKSNDSFNWVSFTKKPVLSPGLTGTFDEHGVYPSSVIKIDQTFYMFYIGWNRGYTSPLFYSSVGIAKSEDGLSFTKMNAGPILARNKYEPILVTAPFVEVDSEIYRMLYVSGIEWIYSSGKLESRYDIKSIESTNINEWSSKKSKSEIPLRAGETNIARPWIFKDFKKKYMYFSFLSENKNGYRIGLAIENIQGGWHREDNSLQFIGLPDNQIMAYPSVIQLMQQRFMFVNGNEYGKLGFYVLKLESEK
jgi:hypothetical protein